MESKDNISALSLGAKASEIAVFPEAVGPRRKKR